MIAKVEEAGVEEEEVSEAQGDHLEAGGIDITIINHMFVIT